MKICICCEIEKENHHFEGKNKKCIECYKEYQKNYREKNKEKAKVYFEEYYKENKEQILENVKEYTINNKEKIAEYKSNYYNDNKEQIQIFQKEYYKINKETLREKNKEYVKNNKEPLKQKRKIRDKRNKDKITENLKLRRQSDPLYRLSQNIRVYIRNSFKSKGYKKSTKTEKILGCTFKEFKSHIESQFEKWMTWENYGKFNGQLNSGWDIDHIIPISSAKNEDEIIKLNNFSNLRPLCSYTNRYIKSDKIL